MDQAIGKISCSPPPRMNIAGPALNFECATVEMRLLLPGEKEGSGY